MTYYKLTYFKYVFAVGAVLFILLTAMEVSARKTRPVEADVIFSHVPGFYEDEFDLVLSGEGGTIYYTLDGSDPTHDSLKYEGPIHIEDASNQKNTYSMLKEVSTGFREDLLGTYIEEDPGYESPQFPVDKCTIVRAAIYYGEERYSPVKTASYFVGYDQKSGYEGMNVVSIVTNPRNLFDYNEGIYVTGKAFDDVYLSHIEDGNFPDRWLQIGNYSIRGRKSERIANCQFFDTNGKLQLSQNCGIRIHGGTTRTYNPKSMNLYAREEYDGNPYLAIDFWGDGYQPSSVTLAQGGQDVKAKFKDYLVHKAIADLDVATTDFSPYVMFLDGEYWGVYWLTEKYNAEYIQYHYGVDEDNVIMMKKFSLEEGEENEIKLYNYMMNFCTTADMTDDENYNRACDLIDIDSYIDYNAALAYISRCHDWPSSNFALWRSRKYGSGEYEDCKWRWMVFDLNSRCMETGLEDFDSIAYIEKESGMFENLMKNDEFRNRFLDRLLELSKTIYSADNIDKEIAEFRSLMDEPMEQNIRRFYGEDKTGLYNDQMEMYSSFFHEREILIKDIVDKHR